MSNVIAIKELAYFVCQSGNLTTEFFSSKDLQTGTRIHQMHQSGYNDDSESEVYIRQELDFNNKTYVLHGFIDGVLLVNNEIIIEEIKSTTVELDEITIDYHKEHLAQLKIYGYLYALMNNIDSIHLRLTYISTINYEEKSFDLIENTADLEDFCFEILEEYINWLELLNQAQIEKEITIKEAKFPFETSRPGQKKLMKNVYNTLVNNDILFAIAPTGIGKTMATIFASLKSLKKNDKLFYVTAKSSGKSAPLKAMEILNSQNVKVKTIEITAKRKICNCNKANCNPDDCPFAQGYFDRLSKATYEIFENENIFSPEKILEVANNNQICAFEFSLYLSYFCDVVIADYNYVFDPHAHLIRYFDNDEYKPKVLVDEAHNLISRSKEMYSSQIGEEDVLALRRKMSNYKPSIRKECNKILELLSDYREHLQPGVVYYENQTNAEINQLFRTLLNKCDQILEENKKSIKNKDEILEVYFKILDFVNVADIYSVNHKTIVKLVNDYVVLNYYCLDASDYLLDTIKSSIHGIVFFSATLYPLEYHMNLLTKGNGNYIELQSPFNPDNLDLIINNNISTKYRNRASTIEPIIETIDVVTNTKPGNYIIFFPSYQYMNMITDALGDDIEYEAIIQKNNFTEKENLEILEKFKTTTNTKVGFFVMGGMFSEGIDLIGEALTGVIIVGVGLPMVCDENNILKDHFEQIYQSGFDYAYTYPGFTKVIQAVGRVIRDSGDRGIAILMDDRFTYGSYLSLFPPHWTNKKVINNIYNLKKEIKDFYSKN